MAKPTTAANSASPSGCRSSNVPAPRPSRDRVGHVIHDRIVPADLGEAEAQAKLDWLGLVAEPGVERYRELVSP
ncbi:hypothetical protein [Amycolatopsis orientalis]|uniref:hypothetical protein n=1 Tax=Amycolatopsis orientalis TaxID=31958 RepID=UPI001319DD33|nr:hypothetical protein [Amycolatopsis orientalis]